MMKMTNLKRNLQIPGCFIVQTLNLSLSSEIQLNLLTRHRYFPSYYWYNWHNSINTARRSVKNSVTRAHTAIGVTNVHCEPITYQFPNRYCVFSTQICRFAKLSCKKCEIVNEFKRFLQISQKRSVGCKFGVEKSPPHPLVSKLAKYWEKKFRPFLKPCIRDLVS